MTAAELLAAASALAGEPLAALEPVRGGGNNRLFRVRGARAAYALKCYPADVDDARERSEREYAALRFLREAGQTDVPAPIGLDRERRIALVTWIDGERVRAHTASDVDALASFALRLHALREAPGARALPPAREAVTSNAELRAQLDRRIARLQDATASPGVHAVLAEIRALAGDGPGEATVLDAGRQTLSPSDVGFHNALRTPAGLAFLDFEYFGWDDPVKLVADVLWHPAMALGASERQKFYGTVADVYGVDRSFGARFERDAPLYGLRWALIALNEFVPALWERRVAAGGDANRDAVLARQLATATAFVERVRARAALV